MNLFLMPINPEHVTRDMLKMSQIYLMYTPPKWTKKQPRLVCIERLVHGMDGVSEAFWQDDEFRVMFDKPLLYRMVRP